MYLEDIFFNMMIFPCTTLKLS